MANAKPTKNDVAIVKMTETTTRIRWVVSCLLLAYFAWLVKDAYVEYLKAQTKTEAWERVTLAFLTAFVTLPLPSVLIVIYRKRIGQFTRDTIGRLTGFERERDPQRSTSGLMEDGSDPPGATP